MINRAKQDELGCQLCGNTGKVLRKREAEELAASYITYHRAALPDNIIGKYFRSPVTEYYCKQCDLRYYRPCLLGDSDYYGTLGKIFPWYYGSTSWDKATVLDYLTGQGSIRVVEIGCGTGRFLEGLKARSIDALGIDLNAEAVREAQHKGLSVYLPGSHPACASDVLCMFQTIEHVERPAEFLMDHMRQFQPRAIILSAPCFNSLLGYTSDPLCWPPHHATCWSANSFAALAAKIGRRLGNVWYDNLDLGTFRDRQAREVGGRIPGLPRLFPPNRIGRFVFHTLQKMGFLWAKRCHSIIVEIR